MAHTPIDSAWIAPNPVPVHDAGTTKNSRGRVLATGGSRMVPGALRLTGEPALRAGAPKLQIATIASAALGLGLLVPEAGVVALAKDEAGEIADGSNSEWAKALQSCETVVVGPGIGTTDAATIGLRTVLDGAAADVTLVYRRAGDCLLDRSFGVFPEVFRPTRGHAASRRDGNADGS